MEREELRFRSGTGECAAWLYRPGGANGTPDAAGEVPIVVMGHGFSLTRHDGLPPYAEALAQAGAAVLVFDYRFLGDSPGEPRQRLRKAEQQEDWRSAVAHARGLPGVDAERVVVWGYSLGGGHAAETAAADERIAGAVLLCPFLDGLARVFATPPSLLPWILPRAFADLAGRPVRIPVTAEPGGRAALTLPGEADGFARAVVPGSPWRNEIAPGIFATVALFRPLSKARRVRCPVWLGLGERDITTSGKSIERFAARAPRAELKRYDYDHFDPFVGDAPARIAGDQVQFLRRSGLLA